MPRKLLFLEFNEINFEGIEFYAARGVLPNFSQIIREYGWQTTTSERQYEHLEPWIQWVTAHTGLEYKDHGILRLGDIVSREIPQIWEFLEAHGLKVGAISPMNAKHRLTRPAFFVPDPWTPTDITAPGPLKQLYRAIAQAVNDNAESKLTVHSAMGLLIGLLTYGGRANYATYLKLALSARTKPWGKAMILDLLLADVFVGEVKRTNPDFATLFLNAGAHIQHHYLFNAESYNGPNRNPSWYVKPGLDPVSEIYQLYDRILGKIQRTFPEARLMLATGLHQEPHGDVTYYWRLSDHARFLKKIGVAFQSVEPRMSRDFLVKCMDAKQAHAAAALLMSAVADDGSQLFEVDNRGTDIFVMLTYKHEITKASGFSVKDVHYQDLLSNVVFVALKNGQHSGIGYFLDTGTPRGSASSEFPLKEIPEKIRCAVGLSSSYQAA